MILQGAMQEVFAQMDEPHGDPGFIKAYAISRAARADITVAIAGDGADELFCGYLPFKAAGPAELLRSLPGSVLRALRGAAHLLPDSDGYLGLQFKALSFLNGVGAPPLERFNLWLSTLERREFAALTRLANDDGFYNFPPELAATLPPLNALDQMSHCYQQIFLPEFVCHHTDRAAMLNSLEVRAPFPFPVIDRLCQPPPGSRPDERWRAQMAFTHGLETARFLRAAGESEKAGLYPAPRPLAAARSCRKNPCAGHHSRSP